MLLRERKYADGAVSFSLAMRLFFVAIFFYVIGHLLFLSPGFDPLL